MYIIPVVIHLYLYTYNIEDFITLFLLAMTKSRLYWTIDSTTRIVAKQSIFSGTYTWYWYWVFLISKKKRKKKRVIVLLQGEKNIKKPDLETLTMGIVTVSSHARVCLSAYNVHVYTYIWVIYIIYCTVYFVVYHSDPESIERSVFFPRPYNITSSYVYYISYTYIWCKIYLNLR